MNTNDIREDFVALTGSEKVEVTLKHLKVMFARMGVSTSDESFDEFLQLKMDAYDFDRNGKLNLEEFGRMMCDLYGEKDDLDVYYVRNNNNDMILHNIFSEIDEDQDGYITRKEMVEALDDPFYGLVIEFQHSDPQGNVKFGFDEFKEIFYGSRCRLNHRLLGHC